MVQRRRSGDTADRFVELTLELIEEQGGSQHVNLREVARRVGVAHTTVYYYFDGFPDLLWEALRRAIVVYGHALAEGLDDTLEPIEYFRRLVTNVATFPQQNPGLFRFITTEPIDADRIPDDVLETVSVLKQWLVDCFAAVSGPEVSASNAENLCNITLGYIDGESVNSVNGRVVPGEDIPGRIVANSLRLFYALTGQPTDGSGGTVSPEGYPRLQLPPTDTVGTADPNQ